MSPCETTAEELRHRLMEIEKDRRTSEAKRKGGEHEEVRKAVDMGEAESSTAGESRRDPARATHEAHVLTKVDAHAGALVALDAQPSDLDPFHHRERGIAGPPETEDDDGDPGPHERLGLTADSAVLVVVGVDEHEDRAPWRPAGTAQGRVDQPAPSRRTWPGMVVRPAELSTESMISPARS